MRLLLIKSFSFAATALFQFQCEAGGDLLKDKIVRAILNHNEPAIVKVGISGVTSLEFPYRIEAIDGYGFSQTPGSGDAFQISYTSGTNYFSVRALKTGATGNLTVVLDQKVYSFFFAESNDPSFVNIYGPGRDSESAISGEQMASEKVKVASPSQLAGLLDKVKNYAAFKSSSPQLLDGLQMAEPGKRISLGNEIESTICRVLKEDSLNSVGFEVEINNQSSNDFLYDPRGIQLRVKNQVYDAALEDAAGIVKAQTKATIFFVVNETASGQQSDLSPDSDFDLVIKEGPELKSDALTFNQPPSDYLPTASTIRQAGGDPESHLMPSQGTEQAPQRTTSPAKHSVSKKAPKKSDLKADSPKDSVAKVQKPVPKKLFGWL
jgi:hypothetical protein